MTLSQSQRYGFYAAMVAVFLGSLLAWAQSEVLLTVVDTGAIVRQVQSDTSGRLIVNSLPANCSTVTQTAVSVTTAAAAVPAAQATSRAYVVICNSKVNSSGLIKCRADGSAPVYASGAGDVLDVGDCIPYAVAASVTPQCIANTGTVVTTTFECRP